MSASSGQQAQDPPPARDKKQGKGAYGARINQLFRDALRDLDELKHPQSRETAK